MMSFIIFSDCLRLGMLISSSESKKKTNNFVYGFLEWTRSLVEDAGRCRDQYRGSLSRGKRHRNGGEGLFDTSKNFPQSDLVDFWWHVNISTRIIYDIEKRKPGSKKLLNSTFCLNLFPAHCWGGYYINHKIKNALPRGWGNLGETPSKARGAARGPGGGMREKLTK